jgi:hypothetical protein
MNPLAGPFLTSLQLCDYSDDPGFAIPPRAETGDEPEKEGDR